MSMSVSMPLDAGAGEEQQTEAEMIIQQDRVRVQEGNMHFCQGPLQRKRHKAQAKIKKWKQKWFKLQPGKKNILVFACALNLAVFYNNCKIICFLSFVSQPITAMVLIS